MRLNLWVFLSFALALSACTGSGDRPATPASQPVAVPAYTPEPSLSDKARFREALLLLERGEAANARAELQLYLVTQPNSKVALDIVRQIDLPPHEYFPSDYREVTLPSGVSLSSLSKRYLGSVFKFHALAKYNGILRPGDLTAGEDIKVPLTAAAIKSFAADDAIVEAVTKDGANASAAPAAQLQQEEQTASDIESAAVEEVKAAAAAPAKPAEPDLSEAQIDKLHRTALRAYRAQNLDKAIALWDRVLAADSTHESAMLYRSQAIELKQKLRRLN
ncbi:MAG: hypothetical protein AB8C02_07920 [Halioglobus sp.]